MPIRIPNDLPAAMTLSNENIFIMPEERAFAQDIRPLRVAILNLMPTKIKTETQLLRLLGNSPLQVDITLLQSISHVSKNTPEEHLKTFYKTWDEVKKERFDGLIITGAPVEDLDFEDVDYWDEICQIMDWSTRHVYSTMHICWGAQAGLYYHYGIAKHHLQEKRFGVYPHNTSRNFVRLLRGFDDVFYCPHSRLTEVLREDILACPELDLVAESEEAGVNIVRALNGRQIYIFGHFEYDADTLKAEYDRDINKGLDIKIPQNYYTNNDPMDSPRVCWRSHANLLFANWLNYYVYQDTPYDLKTLSPEDDVLKSFKREFYQRDTETVAQDLLGRYLVHETSEGTTVGRIVDTEAYQGQRDKAAHCYKGRTKRNEIMFGIGGHAYVYFIYGMYSCFNVVTRDLDQPEGVLIRQLEPIQGIELMMERRKTDKVANLTNGPGKLCQAMGIDFRRHNGMDLCGGQLYITEGEPVPKTKIKATPRINIDYAEEALHIYGVIS